MELVILLVVVIGVLGWFLWRDRTLDQSGNHPLDGATKTTTKPDGIGHESVPVPTLTNVLDVNKDGRVDLKDAVAAAEVVVEKTKKTATKAKAKVKETATKVKTAAKKTTAKKPKTK